MEELIEQLTNKIENSKYVIEKYQLLKKMHTKLDSMYGAFVSENFRCAEKILGEITIEDLEKFLSFMLLFDDGRQQDETTFRTIQHIINSRNISMDKKYEYVCTWSLAVRKIKEEIGEDLEEFRKMSIDTYQKIFGVGYEEAEQLFKIFNNKNSLYTPLYIRLIFDVLVNRNNCIDTFSKSLVRDLIVSNNMVNTSIMLCIQQDSLRQYLALFQTIRLVLKYEGEVLKEYDKKTKQVRRQIGKDEETIKLLEKLNSNLGKQLLSMADVRKLFGNFNLSDEQKEIILEKIVIGNRKYLNRKVIHFGSKEEIKMLLAKYKYDYELLDKDTKINIGKVNKEQIDKDLEALKKLHIRLTYNNLAMIINKGIEASFYYLEVLFKREVIDNEIINNNIQLLVEKNYLDNVYGNIIMLEQNGINIKEHSCVDLLMKDSKYLEQMISMYNKYNINLGNLDYNILGEDKYLDLIDMFVEQGLYDFIKNNSQYISQEGFNVVKRVRINNLIGEDIINNGELVSDVVNENLFGIYNNFLDEYCSNSISLFQNDDLVRILDESRRIVISDDLLQNSIIKDIDSKYLEDNIYNIGGILISRNKVLRNYEQIKNSDYSDYSDEEKVFNAMIYNSIFSCEQLEIISKNVCGRNVYTKK